MDCLIRHPLSLEHETGSHPENAGRILAIEERLASEDHLGLRVVEAPAAEPRQVEAVHTAGHRERIERLAAGGGGPVDADTVVSPRSYEAALHAAGGAVHAADLVLGGDAGFCFCALRPPGHHAEGDRAMGFCLFNNVAVCAAHARAAHGVERVMVVDWDVHHGNGTQAIFYSDPGVLYLSIHQSPLYPGTGSPAERGEGEGEGLTVNLPLAPGSGGAEARALIEEVAVAELRRYRPELLLVSAGFDAHRDDPLADLELEAEDYRRMAETLAAAAAEVGAPAVACLEGGYAPQALAASVSATIRGFTGQPGG